VFVIAFLSTTRNVLPQGLVPVLAHLAFGGLVYGCLFLMFGLDRDERQWFMSAFHRISGREPRLATGDVTG
jgi:hypothetical protein